MPVPLSTEDDYDRWIGGTPGEAFPLIRDFPPD
jgi:hypothetical protein